MQVTVRYFAAAREAAGTPSEDLEVEDGATVGAIRDLLLERHPDLEAVLPGLRFAVGERFSTPEAALAAGQTLALLPPVSGG